MQRVVGTLLLGLLLAWCTIASSPFQTWLAQRTLNELTATLGMEWNVAGASIELFPPNLELRGIQMKQASNGFLEVESTRVSAGSLNELMRQGHIDAIDIRGVNGRISTDLFAASQTTPGPGKEPLQFSIQNWNIQGVALEWVDESTPTQLSCNRISAQEMAWDGKNLTGAAEVSDAKLVPLRNEDDQLWSLPWEDTTAVSTILLHSANDASQSSWAIDMESNWGSAALNWQNREGEHGMQFAFNPTPLDWPVDSSQSWMEPIRRLLHEEQITGNLSWDNTNVLAGTLSGMGIELPMAIREREWSIGPIEIERSLLESAFEVSPLTCPEYLTSSPRWQATLAHQDGAYQAVFEASEASDKALAINWNGSMEQAHVEARAQGIGLQLEDAGVVPGLWEIAAVGQTVGNGWSGTIHANHPEGDEIESEWGVQFVDSSWTLHTTSQLHGLTQQGNHTEWAMHGQFNWRASGNGLSEWTHVAEMRNIVLLENGAPRTFERFDAVQTKKGNQWNLRWDSDFTTGQLSCNTALLTDWRFDPISATLIPITASPASAPSFEGIISVTQWPPIALLTDAPLEVPKIATVQANWEGTAGSLLVDVPEVSGAGIKASGVKISGRLGDVNNAGLEWRADAVGLNGDLLVNDLAGSIQPEDSEIQFAIAPFTGELWGQKINLTDPLKLHMDSKTGSLQSAAFSLHTPIGAVNCAGAFEDDLNWHLSATWNSGSEDWSFSQNPISVSNALGQVQIAAKGGAPQLDATVDLDRITWSELSLRNLECSASGALFSPRLQALAHADSTGSILITTQLDLANIDATKSRLELRGFPLEMANSLFPPASVALDGRASGKLMAKGLSRNAEILGSVEVADGILQVPYLGTEYRIGGTIDVRPDGFYLDQWTLQDGANGSGSFNGTALHESFSNWSMDFGIELQGNAMELINIPATQDALFYGQARGTGDINVSGYGPYLQIDARINTGKGTDFALPMDSRSDVDYAGFIRFKGAANEATTVRAPRGYFSDVTLNLGIDVEEGARARIVFDRGSGDEIVGEAVGHVDLAIDDFEELRMNGNLEITKGAYHFTLQNWLNKRFDIQPGSTIAWRGDPYDAELSIATTYVTRTTLDPLLPDVPDLPGRLPVELGLQLDGSMLRPHLDFGIEVPSADSRIQALLEGALVSEEAIQRQALGLLVMGQFLPSNPAEASVGGFIQPAQSTQFLANQLGHWISQIAPAVDVGLDYAQDALSGEQALGLALSTQILNDRLHIEGELGAQSTGQVNAEDLQIQDLTVSFDLTPEGNIQLTGHTRQNANLTPAIEGQSVQGVGVRFKWAFDQWRASAED